VGKTSVVTEFVYKCQSCFDAVLWVRVDDIAKLDESFSRIAVELQLVQAVDTLDRVIRRNLVLDWTCEPRRATIPEGGEAGNYVKLAKWLLVFDHADNITLLGDYWPKAAINGSILVTSRDSLTKTKLASHHKIQLGHLDSVVRGQLILNITASDGHVVIRPYQI